MKPLSLVLVAAAPMGAASLERVATSCKRDCPSCDTKPSLTPKRLTSIRADTTSLKSSLGGARMRDASLSEHWARIASSASGDNDKLERQLLGTVQVEITALHRNDRSSVPTYDPLFSNDKWVLVASGALMATSAILLTMYLSGGIAASASALRTAASVSTSLAAPTASTAAIDRFNWLLRGGGANYVTGKVSVGILALRNLQPLGHGSIATHFNKRMIPSTIRVIKKMIIMEVWRRVWLVVFHQFAKSMRSISRGTDRFYKKHCPLWIRLGIKNIFKSSVQRAVHGALGQWVGHISTGARDLYADMMSSATSDAAQDNLVEGLVEAASESVTESASEAMIEAITESAASKVAETIVESAVDASSEDSCSIVDALADAVASSD